MSNEYTSTAMRDGEAIDCRMLTLNVEFYQLNKHEAQSVACEVVQWLSQLVEDGFVVRRTIERRSVSISRAMQMMESAFQQGHTFSNIVEALAKSPVVYNLAKFSEYFRNIRTSMCYPSLTPDLSIDYPQFWDNLFPGDRVDRSTVKENILRIFREEQRKMIARFILPDVQSLLRLSPYQSQNGLYFGSFDIDFSAYCLNSKLPDMAKTFSDFAKHLSESYKKLNARVMLQPCVGPSRNPYMTLFGTPLDTDGSHIDAGCSKMEWYSTYYIPGVEWYNIISPLAMNHISDPASFADMPTDIAINTLNHGGIELYSRKDILQYDIPDALNIKRYAYPALFPGMKVLPLKIFNRDETFLSMSNFPRHNWAIIPVFENEIDIVGTDLVFSKDS